MTRQQKFFDEVFTTAKSLGASDTLAAIAAAQSAIETGWGEHVKGNSYFGVKAFKSWTGNRTRFTTSEYENGIAVKQKLSFRAYEGLEQATRDYLQVIKNAFPQTYKASNLKQASNGLGQGVFGRYATDLKYEQKVLSIASNYWKQARKQTSDTKPKLQRGDTGAFVNELLTILEKWKFYSGPQDSIFGGGAEAAVRHFQKDAKIQVDGIVGKVTWSKLAEWNKFASEITAHLKGAGVFLVNQSAIRNQSVTAYLMDTLEDGMSFCFGQGCRAEIYSGGQPSLGTSDRRTGSVRHDKGRAMDVHIFWPNGRQIIGCRLIESRATPHQSFPLLVWNSSGRLVIKDNDLSVGFNANRIDYQALGNVTEFIEMNNRGHVTDVILDITVPAGSNSATVAHGISPQSASVATDSGNTFATVMPINGEAQTKNTVAGITGTNLSLFAQPAPATPAIFKVRLNRYSI